jgi:hypothetical protein
MKIKLYSFRNAFITETNGIVTPLLFVLKLSLTQNVFKLSVNVIE